MKKNELKEILKPMIKECVREALYEEGLLSNVVAEVVKGMQPQNLTEEQHSAVAPSAKEQVREQDMIRTKAKESREQLMRAIGQDSYNGVNLFEGTQAISSYEAQDPKPGSIDLGDPNDAGVDISSIMGGATKMWQAMK